MNGTKERPRQEAPTGAIEDRIFRRGVTDEEVRTAMVLVNEYVGARVYSSKSDLDWWSEFKEFYDDLTRNFTPAQTAAFEIATDTILVGFGLSTWTIAQTGLRRRPAMPTLPDAA
ncbi:hypothetical protein HF319_09120 [Xanthomonas sp. Kuri4-1]